MDVLLTLAKNIDTRLSSLEEIIQSRFSVSSPKEPMQAQQPNQNCLNGLDYRSSYSPNLRVYSYEYKELDGSILEIIRKELHDKFIPTTEASRQLVVPISRIYALCHRTDRLASVKIQQTNKILISRNSLYTFQRYLREIGGIQNDTACMGITYSVNAYKSVYSNNPLLNEYIEKYYTNFS